MNQRPFESALEVAVRITANGNTDADHTSRLIRSRDAALVARCAELLDERGHRLAAHSLRKMAREGKVP